MSKKKKKKNFSDYKKNSSVKNYDQVSSFWIFGIHSVQYALLSKKRRRKRLLVSQNAFNKLKEPIETSKVEYKIINSSSFKSPISSDSVHQGALLEVETLKWGSISEVCKTDINIRSIVVLLDRVSDPQNVGAILRTAEFFGVRAVIAPHRHSPPETGSLAKSASGALESTPYLRVPNLSQAISSLKKMNYSIIGLEGSAKDELKDLDCSGQQHLALVFGSESLGLRRLTAHRCDNLARISSESSFASLNVSNAVAISLYAAYNNLIHTLN